MLTIAWLYQFQCKNIHYRTYFDTDFSPEARIICVKDNICNVVTLKLDSPSCLLFGSAWMTSSADLLYTFSGLCFSQKLVLQATFRSIIMFQLKITKYGRIIKYSSHNPENPEILTWPNVNIIAAGALRADGATAPRRRLGDFSRRAHTSSTAAAAGTALRVLTKSRVLNNVSFKISHFSLSFIFFISKI